MKTKVFLLILACCATLQLSAQNNPLVGAWGANDGKQKEIKIFTPTHFMFFIQDLKTDTLTGGGGGTYSVAGNKLTENLMSVDFTHFLTEEEQYKKMKAEYDITVAGGKFTQKGTFVISDTSQIPIYHEFTRIKSDNAYPNNPALGAWKQLSSSGVSENGTKWSHTNATHTRFQLITPTHWMRTSAKNKEFENQMGGTYTMERNKIKVNLDFASFPIDGATTEITQRVEGNKMYWSGILKDKDGKQTDSFEDVFERAGAKPKIAKAASVK